MCHQLLATWRGRPHRAHIVGVVLNAQVRHALTEVERGTLVVLVPDRPTPQLGVEPHEDADSARSRRRSTSPDSVGELGGVDSRRAGPGSYIDGQADRHQVAYLKPFGLPHPRFHRHDVPPILRDSDVFHPVAPTAAELQVHLIRIGAGHFQQSRSPVQLALGRHLAWPCGRRGVHVLPHRVVRGRGPACACDQRVGRPGRSPSAVQTTEVRQALHGRFRTSDFATASGLSSQWARLLRRRAIPRTSSSPTHSSS